MLHDPTILVLQRHIRLQQGHALHWRLLDWIAWSLRRRCAREFVPKIALQKKDFRNNLGLLTRTRGAVSMLA